MRNAANSPKILPCWEETCGAIAIGQYVLILGAAVWQHGKPSTTLLRRTLCALDIANETGALLICTGGVGRHPPSEAEVAAQIAVDRGFSEERILLDRTSISTIENLRNAQDLILADSTVIIVTDKFHSRRALMLAKEVGMKATIAVPDSRYPKSRMRVYVRGWLRELAAITVVLGRRHLLKVEKV